MSFLKALRGKSSPKSKSTSLENDIPQLSQKIVTYEDPWLKSQVEPLEVVELLKCCSAEIKSRGLSSPFLLLPFRPTTEGASGRTFIRSYFSHEAHKLGPLRGERLARELRLTDVEVICSIIRWVWARLPGGIVTWEAYELFKVGETDSGMMKDAFSTFIPLSVDSKPRADIIVSFFDLLSAIAANGKANGLSGLKLSSFAGWWAFEHVDTGFGFEGGYTAWAKAADATSHLFFAYLRSLAGPKSTVSVLPISLQQLLNGTEYPPTPSAHLHSTTTQVVMTVQEVSPTPFALLRRARNFQFRDDDPALQEFSDVEDPVQSLTEECRRVLKCISATNSSSIVKAADQKTETGDQSWNRFQDMGFSVLSDSDDDGDVDEDNTFSSVTGKRRQAARRTNPKRDSTDLARPTTPSWADFMASGFGENVPDTKTQAPLFIPPDKLLPAIETSRAKSSQSNRNGDNLHPGELASCGKMNMDDAFWWVWMTSLGPEESASRKAVFGRCAMIETTIRGCGWIVIEEQVKGAVPEILEGDIYLATKKDKKSKRSFLSRNKSSMRDIPQTNLPNESTNNVDLKSINARKRMTISPEQQATIKNTAATLRNRRADAQTEISVARPRPNPPDRPAEKTNTTGSLFQPVNIAEASQAMKWANNYDKQATREAYLGKLGSDSSERALPPIPLSSQASFAETTSTRDKSSYMATPALNNLYQTSTQPTSIPDRTPSPVLSGEHFAGTFMEAEVPQRSITPEPTREQPSQQASLDGRREVVSPTMTLDSDDAQETVAKKTGRLRRLFSSTVKKPQERPPPASPTHSNGNVKSGLAVPGDQMGRRPSLLQKKRPAEKEREATPIQANVDSAKPMNIIVKQVEEPTPFQSYQTAQASPSDTPSRRESIDMFNPEHEEPSHITEKRVEQPLAPVVHDIPDTQDVHTSEKPIHVPQSSFGQGPLTEQPAFVPEDISPEESPRLPPQDYSTPDYPRSSALSVVSDHSEDEMAPPVLPPPPPPPQQAPPPPPPPPSTQAPASSGSQEHEPEPAVQDRWAQIRKNAAERAKLAQNSASKENLALPATKPQSSVLSRVATFETKKEGPVPQVQKTPPKVNQYPIQAPKFPIQAAPIAQIPQPQFEQSSIDQSQDEGETSGEETIESRVARIKARVAELTGSVEHGQTVTY